MLEHDGLTWEPDVVSLNEERRVGFERKLAEYGERVEKLRGQPGAEERLHTYATRMDIIAELLEKGEVDLGFWRAVHKKSYVESPAVMAHGQARVAGMDNEVMYALSGSYDWPEAIAGVIKAYNAGDFESLERGTSFEE